MAFNLDDTIDNYIQDVEAFDRKVAQHLKEIIPNTTHLDENTFLEIIEDLKKEMDNGENFKNAFHKMCKKYILTGDVISADLPEILTRVILNDLKFLEKIAKDRSISLSRENIKRIIDSRNWQRIVKLLKNLTLSVKKVVFATFDEGDPDADPFKKYKLNDVINMLALDKESAFKENRPLTAVSIRYKNKDDVLKRFPIFPDAGWNDKFYPSGKDDKYGRTKSLDPLLKNMPEIVHKNLKLAEVIEDIRFLEE
jgi:hypothetical protein